MQAAMITSGISRNVHMYSEKLARVGSVGFFCTSVNLEVFMHAQTPALEKGELVSSGWVREGVEDGVSYMIPRPRMRQRTMRFCNAILSSTMKDRGRIARAKSR